MLRFQIYALPLRCESSVRCAVCERFAIFDNDFHGTRGQSRVSRGTRVARVCSAVDCPKSQELQLVRPRRQQKCELKTKPNQKKSTQTKKTHSRAHQKRIKNTSTATDGFMLLLLLLSSPATSQPDTLGTEGIPSSPPAPARDAIFAQPPHLRLSVANQPRFFGHWLWPKPRPKTAEMRLLLLLLL